MTIHKLDEIKNKTLHDAILITSIKYTFVKVYIDPNNECAISFKSKMSEEDIKLFFFNINPYVTSESSPKDEIIKDEIDYYYNSDTNTTYIYTKDEWKY